MTRIAPLILCFVLACAAFGCGPPVELFSGTYSSVGKVTFTQTSPVSADPYPVPFFRDVVVVPGDTADLYLKDEPCWHQFDVQDSVSAAVSTRSQCSATVKGTYISYLIDTGSFRLRGRTATVVLTGTWTVEQDGRMYSGTVTTDYELTKLTK